MSHNSSASPAVDKQGDPLTRIVVVFVVLVVGWFGTLLLNSWLAVAAASLIIGWLAGVAAMRIKAPIALAVFIGVAAAGGAFQLLTLLLMWVVVA
ncbi:hypothetical protein VZC37_15795 [Gordonia sp. LSe1-13]|uniref:Uncharacterized protein n=1 Tax=Gordonia sesuvii TaxID=3116777 RepID=A0ABU7MGT8_9ACTN|nr:hypothetical protein [Gordonia sp. LSe1-13]